MSNAWVLITVVAILSGVAITWIKAKNGYPLHDHWGGNKDSASHIRREDILKQIDDAISSRDKTIAQLEERVRVLERIVTDDSRRLSSEIDGLRKS